MKPFHRVFLFLILASIGFTPSGYASDSIHPFEIKIPALVLTDVNFTIEVTAKDSVGNAITTFHDSVVIDGVERNIFGRREPAMAVFFTSLSVTELAAFFSL